MNADDCIRIHALKIPKRGSMKIADKIGLLLYPKAVAVVFGGRPPRGQSIKRTGNKKINQFVCPVCGRTVHTLYLPPGSFRFACKTCTGITTYGAWQRNGRVREPVTPAAWFRWFLQRARKGGDIR